MLLLVEMVVQVQLQVLMQLQLHTQEVAEALNHLFQLLVVELVELEVEVQEAMALDQQDIYHLPQMVQLLEVEVQVETTLDHQV